MMYSMKEETVSDMLDRVENIIFNIGRHKEFREHFENYRSQIGVLQSLRFALNDMNLHYLLEKD